MLENFANLWVGGTGFYSPVGFPNPRTSDDIDMKLGPVTKLDKKNKTTSKQLTMASFQEIMMPFLVHLDQSGSRIPDI